MAEQKNKLWPIKKKILLIWKDKKVGSHLGWSALCDMIHFDAVLNWIAHKKQQNQKYNK